MKFDSLFLFCITVIYIIVFSHFMNTGNDKYKKKPAEYTNMSDIVREPGDYIRYTMYDGTVVCREHLFRPELACWKK